MLPLSSSSHRSVLGHAVLGILLGSGLMQVRATPLRPRFTSCLASFNAAGGDAQMVVSDVFANLVSGQEAQREGLIGDGHDVLRVDLVGTVGSDIAGYDNGTNKLATLFTDTSTAHLSVYESTTWLCNSLFPPDLPTPYFPYNTTYCPLPAGPFALNLSIPLYRSYALTTLRTQVRIVDTSLNALTLACYNIDFTPYREDGWYYHLFLYLPIALAIGFWTVTWAARFATGWIVGSGVAEYGVKEGHASSRVSLPMGTKREVRMRKWGTMIISGLSGERLSVSSALLRFVTPGLRDILYYIQFSTMLGMIAVDWPAFAYPILAQGAWADLVWNMTLVQGSHASDKRIDVLPPNYTAPAPFANMMADPYYPLYLDPNSFNPLLDLGGARHGMESWARAVGLRPQDLFGTCLVIFLCLTLGVTLISLLLWALHGIFEYTSAETRRLPNRNSLGSSPQASLGGKEAYEPRSYGWDSEGPQLPTQASLAAARNASAPSRLRKTWLRFRLKGEAGAFHAAALYGNLIRLILVFHLPVTAFSVYQLSLSSASIVSRVFAALALVFISFAIPAGILFKIKRTPSGKLYDATRTLLALGPMYNVYIEEKQMFRVFPLLASLIEGVVVGGGQKSGITQAIIFVLVELAMLILPAIWYPWGEGASMGAPSAFVGIIRVACAVLVMLLSRPLAMDEATNDWIAYSVLILTAVVFVFFMLMLLTKLVEGFIRLFGGAHFDESTSPLDSGLFAAIMDLDCLNGVRGGKAAQRKRRKRGSRQLQRNVSAAGSLTTQMMLDRHSLGITRQAPSEGNTPFLSPYPQYDQPYDQQRLQSSYFPGYQPPLGPPPLERHSSDSRSDEPSASGHIMDAWKPTQPIPQSPGSVGFTSSTFFPPADVPGSGPTRSFSVVRGGRADYQNPYDVQAGSPTRSLSPPALRIAAPSKPAHTRQHSSSAVIERLDSSAPPSPRLGQNAPSLYPPGREGPRPNSQGLRPPLLAIPKRRSLNNLKEDASIDSSPSDTTPKGKKAKRRSKSSGWFAKPNEDPESSPAEESDDEPGPSRKRIPKPFEPAPSPLGEKKGWRAALGLVRKKSLDDMAELARDENKARKAALAAASGSMFAGVEAPPAPSRGFVVNRKGPTTKPGDRASAALSPVSASSGEEGRSFKVKRMGQPMPQPVSVPLAPPAASPPAKGTGTSGATSQKTAEPTPKKGFRVIGRPAPSPVTSSARSEEKRGSFVVNRPNSSTPMGTSAASPTAQLPKDTATAGYPSDSFVPVAGTEGSDRWSRGSGDAAGGGRESGRGSWTGQAL